MDEKTLWQAVHMLHEEAHGQVPFVTCRAEPCRHLSSTPYGAWPSGDHPDGPAPLTLPFGRKDH